MCVNRHAILILGQHNFDKLRVGPVVIRVVCGGISTCGNLLIIVSFGMLNHSYDKTVMNIFLVLCITGRSWNIKRFYLINDI